MSPFFLLPDIRRLTFGFTNKKMLLEWGEQQQQQKGGSSVGPGLGRDDS
jgi:hypothetical protein